MLMNMFIGQNNASFAHASSVNDIRLANLKEIAPSLTLPKGHKNILNEESVDLMEIFK